MSEQLKESLSAIIDDEADEFELRRVLDEIGQDEELRLKWSRYHLIASILRGEGMSESASTNIWRVIDDEAQPEVVDAAELDAPQAPRNRNWIGGLVGAGVAAGVAMAVVVLFGGDDFGDEGPGAQIADIQPSQPVSPIVAAIPSEYDLKRANAYIIQHSQHVSMKNRATLPFVKMMTHASINVSNGVSQSADAE